MEVKKALFYFPRNKFNSITGQNKNNSAYFETKTRVFVIPSDWRTWRFFVCVFPAQLVTFFF